MATASDVLSVARSMLGTRGGATVWAYLGYGSSQYGEAWCAAFVNYCLTRCGMGLPKAAVNCGTGSDWGIQYFLSKAGAVRVNVSAAKPGDVAIYTFRSGYYNHTGIIESVGSNSVTSIDGNVSNTCGRRTYPFSQVAAVWRPKYVSASTGTSTSASNASTSKTVDQVAQEVIDGKWGNGSDRKARLEAAGYSYSTVQAKVNELLGFGSASTSSKASGSSASSAVTAGTYKIVTAVGLRARRAPSLSGAITYVWPCGSRLTLDGTTVTADGYVWARYVAGGTGGYRYIAVHSTDGSKVYAVKV